METLGFLCLIAALVVVILKLFVLKDKPILKWVAVGCLAAAGNIMKQCAIHETMFVCINNKKKKSGVV